MKTLYLTSVVAASLIALLFIPTQKKYPQALLDKVGNEQFFDSVIVLAGSRPELVDTMPTSEVTKSLGWTCWVEKFTCLNNVDAIYLATYTIFVNVSYTTIDSIWTRHVTEERRELDPETVRGVALHEFGHWLSVTSPNLRKAFGLLTRTRVGPGPSAEAFAEWMMDELFADAFAMSVRKRGFPGAYADPYRFYHSWITLEQIALMDSVVNARWDKLPK